MKIRLLFSLLTLSLVAIPAVRAADAAAPAASKSDKDEPETELGKKMEKMNSAFRKLRNQVKDPTKNADSLQLIAVLREHGEASLKFDPIKAKDVAAADRPKYIAGYQAKMKDFLAELGKLEAALTANNNEEAAAVFQSINQLQKEGHKEYRPKK